MAEGRDLVKEAIQDAKSLKEAAMESAKTKLIEELAPAVRKLLDESIKGALHERDRTGPSEWDKSPEGGTRQQKKDYGDLAVAEDVEPVPEGLDLESALQEFFPAEGTTKENVDMATEVKESAKFSKKGEEKKSSKKEAVETAPAVSEEIEISEAELRKVYEAALQTEVSVKKGFSDFVGGGELGDTYKELGIESPPKDKEWEKEEPPHKKDWIPEGAVRQMIAKGIAENKALRENLKKAVSMVETLGRKLHEVNLFNAKVLHVNKVLNSGIKLTREQKTYVMESIDGARSISEVKMVFKTIVEGFRTTTAALTESRQVRPPKADAQKMRSTGTPKQEVLSESVDRAAGGDKFSRMRELAGIVNGKKA